MRFILFLFAASFIVAEESPFPQNRIRDFYKNQAEKYLQSKKPIPKLLPEFPGLDGGAWGYWGQNPESDNYDDRLNEVDTGKVLSQVVKVGPRHLNKGVCVHTGSHTVLFDPEKLTFVSEWTGGLVKWQSRRYGITSGVTSSGKPNNSHWKLGWKNAADLKKKYLGYYKWGERVIFRYIIDDIEILDSVWERDGKLIRGQIVKGKSAPPFSLESGFAKGELKVGELKPKALWANQKVVTKGILGKPEGCFAIDTLTIPYRDANPFKTPMRIGGVGAMPDGRIAVCTLMGDVWIVDGVNADFHKLTWTRFAAGLHQPAGMVVDPDGKIVVICRDQLTRLHDENGDGEADYYECVTNEFPTERGNNFALTLHRDEAGNYYWFTRSAKFGMTKYTPGSKPVQVGIGLRGTNGTGASPDGKIVYATVQDGSWAPAQAIFETKNKSYHGFFGPKPEFGEYGYQMPLCFMPRGVENSPGDIIFLPEDERLGPLSGRVIGTSFGYCTHYLILREEIGDSIQGGIVPLPGEFLSGAHRASFNKKDGCLYIAGSDGWQSYAQENGSLQRLRYVGGEMDLPTQIETLENGMIVRFNTEIDPDSLTPKNAFAEQWNYLYSSSYGSAEYSARDPSQFGHDYLPVTKTILLGDKKSVFFEIPEIDKVMQFHLYAKLKTASGRPFIADLYTSIFNMRPAYKYDGYVKTEKKGNAPFPVQGKIERDPRLIQQEKLGRTLSEMIRREVKAVAGLQFEPKTLTVPAGKRVALKVTNADDSMPHNLVLVESDRLEAVGQGSMKLAADPKGAQKHFTIEDDGVIAMSPLLHSGGAYTIYFQAPKKPGKYPYICTYPGHWQVTRGVLTVE